MKDHSLVLRLRKAQGGRPSACGGRRVVCSSGEKETKVLTREQIAAILATASDRYGLLFEVLATPGLRVSEAIRL